MRRWFEALACATFTLAPCVALADAQSTAAVARAGVVKITANFGGDNPATKHGFGFVAGERAGFLYIATANHVVRTDVDDTPAATTSVQFFSDQGVAYPATVLETHRAAPLDLAVIKVARPASLPASVLCDDSQMLRRDMPVAYVGRDGEWYVPTSAGTVNSDAPDEGFHIEIDFSRTVAVKEGTSGAPLVSERGLVGMIIQDSSSNVATVLATEAIARAFQGWNYPWAARACPRPPEAGEGFELGVRVGYGLPFGKFDAPSDPISTAISPTIPIVIEGGYHLTRTVIVGALFQYAGLELTDAQCRRVSSDTGQNCGGSQLRAGLFVQYHRPLRNRFAVWGGFGAGYEWLSTGSDLGSYDFKGWEVARLEIGGDVLVARRVAIGPFASFSFSRFDWGKDTHDPNPNWVNLNISGGTDLRSWHEWLVLGVRTTVALTR